MTEKEVAKAIGVSQPTFARWKAQRPALRDAWDRGKEVGSRRDLQPTFREYVYQRLSPELQALWDEINAMEEADNDIARVEAMLEGQGKRARQHLFLYALTSSNFNISRAMRKLNIRRAQFDGWVANEPEFAELMAEIHWHKKNFFEDALIQRVAAGDTPAVIFAAKTQLKDRGYHDKIDINVQQDINVTSLQVSVSFDELELPLAVRRQVLQAMRAVPQRQVLEATQ